MDAMDKQTNQEGTQMTDGTVPYNNLRRANSDSDISVGSVNLVIVEDDESADVNVEVLSDADENVGLSNKDVDRLFAQKDEEIAFLRYLVGDLQKTVKEQDEKINDLSKSVEKHESMLNGIVEGGVGALLKNVKDGEHESESGNSGTGLGQREQATAKGHDQHQQESQPEYIPSCLGASGTSDEVTSEGSASRDTTLPKKKKSVRFGETFYEGGTSQPEKFYQHNWQRDGQRGGLRKHRFLNETRAEPYKKQETPHFRGRGQGYRGRGSQLSFRRFDQNAQRQVNNGNASCSVAKEPRIPLNRGRNLGYPSSGGVKERRSALAQLLDEIEDDEIFQCPHCPWKFGERQNMEKHCDAMHQFYKCQLCKKVYGFQESLRRHMKSAHDV